MVERGAARFTLDAAQQRADEGRALRPRARGRPHRHAGPEGWAYKVLYVEPSILHEWAERDGPAPPAARWVVFRRALARPRRG
ncbi:MAG: hypothetical protein M3071_25450 [Actinomycetota bacterium]|nr:hypothetical protein [Actinomycetota bacterium]